MNPDMNPDMSKEILVERHDGPAWTFVRMPNGTYLCQQRQNVYRLFWEPLGSTYKPVWIGRLTPKGDAWFTAEKAIKAKSVVLEFGRYVFA